MGHTVSGLGTPGGVFLFAHFGYFFMFLISC